MFRFVANCLLALPIFAICVQEGSSFPEPWIRQDAHMHKHDVKRQLAIDTNQKETKANYWKNEAQLFLNDQVYKVPNTKIAKNVILFLGDGMSIPTITAARIYIGKKNGNTGEAFKLSFEKFPYSGFSKTYCVNSQVADSACSATAYLCGVKANLGTIGVTAAVALSDCAEMTNTDNHVTSIAKWSQMAGKMTGIVTTTRVTHASPAGVYAHTANRDWESDADIVAAQQDPVKCTDIARQLVFGDTGKHLNVVLGGGRADFLPQTQTDDEGLNGNRQDGRHLIDQWRKSKIGQPHDYIWNREQLLNVSSNTRYLLGLFDPDHLPYHLEKKDDDPSLAEMTEAALKILSQEPKGYFLFVEGGRIDHGHHDAKAKKALDETEQFHRAVQRAVEITNSDDTLIVVTADHAHTMSISGYPARGSDILGQVGKVALDNLPFTTLNYANGPGYRKEEQGQRYDVSQDDTSDNNYVFPGIAPLSSETHGGDDVGIFALGPWAHLFTGVMEENVIPHAMAFASCVGDGITVCDRSH